MNKPEVMKQLLDFIQEVERETELSRKEFVIVCHPDCPLFKRKNGFMEVVANVGIVRHERIYKQGIYIVPRADLDDLDEIIREFAMYKANKNDMFEVVSADDIAPFISCEKCGHPISDALKKSEFLVNCPWCNKVNVFK